MNSIILMGRITKDIELKMTGAGNEYCKFTIAVDREYVSKSGERETDFIPCGAFGKTASFIADYFKRGSMIAVRGALETSQYTDRNGNNATWYEVKVDRAYFTGEKRETPAPVQQKQIAPTQQVVYAPADDDYPFA